MSEQKQAQHTSTGTLTRILHTVSDNDVKYAIISMCRDMPTGTTADASTPRHEGCRSYMVCSSVPGFLCLLSLVGYLLGDLPVSSLVYSDPAWPARLLTRVYKVMEYLRVQRHPRVSQDYSSTTAEKWKEEPLQWMLSNALIWQRFKKSVTTRAIDDPDLIVVGSHSYVIPEVLYPTLDTLHCGDDVIVTYEVNGRVTGLVKYP